MIGVNGVKIRCICYLIRCVLHNDSFLFIFLFVWESGGGDDDGDGGSGRLLIWTYKVENQHTEFLNAVKMCCSKFDCQVVVWHSWTLHNTQNNDVLSQSESSAGIAMAFFFCLYTTPSLVCSHRRVEFVTFALILNSQFKCV